MIKVEMDQIIEEMLLAINIVYYWKDVFDCMIWSVFVCLDFVMFFGYQLVGFECIEECIYEIDFVLEEWLVVKEQLIIFVVEVMNVVYFGLNVIVEDFFFNLDEMYLFIFDVCIFNQEIIEKFCQMLEVCYIELMSYIMGEIDWCSGSGCGYSLVSNLFFVDFSMVFLSVKVFWNFSYLSMNVFGVWFMSIGFGIKVVFIDMGIFFN